MLPDVGPRAILVFAIVLAVAIVFVGLLLFARIWRREPEWKTVAETETTEAIEQIGYSSAWLDRLARGARALVPLAGAERARQLHSKAIELRARAADRREAEHAAVLSRELAAGPTRRPYDGEHRRGVPIHTS